MPIDADRLRNTRIEKGYSQEKLAALAGVNRRTIQRAETGESVSLETLEFIADALGIDKADIRSTSEDNISSDNTNEPDYSFERGNEPPSFEDMVDLAGSKMNVMEVSSALYRKELISSDEFTTFRGEASKWCECRNCGTEVRKFAKTCPECQVKNPFLPRHEEAQENITEQGIINAVTGIAVLAFIVWFIFSGNGSDWVKGVGGNCEVIATEATPDIFIINGEPDYGYQVVSRIKKTKRKGDVSVTVSLSSNEGAFTKEKEVFGLEENEVREVILRFPEPTVNTQGGQTKVGCATI